MSHNRLLFSLISISLMTFLAACGSASDAEPTQVISDDMSSMAMDMPEELDTSTEKMSEGGVFNVAVSSNMDPVEINEIHSWTIHLESADGDAIEGAEITVDGGMPQHNHGFPTTPEVTEDLGGGDYLLEGMKFSMAGWWELKLAITNGDESDSVTFNLMME